MNDIDNILRQYREIENDAASQDRFFVISIENMAHKLGRSHEGFPKFFVRTSGTASSVQNVIREILSIEYNVPCDLIDSNGNRQTGDFSIITLRSGEKALQSYFIEIFCMMLKKLPEIPSRREISIEIENLISIFSALANPPKKKIQGLWTELLLIEQSSHPETLINAWHNSPTAKYDFTMGRDKIEVKSTSKEERVHSFSLDQLNPSPSSRLLIASTIVRESAAAVDGLSVKGLYNKICSRVTAINSRLRLYSVIAETIGNDFNKLENSYFDYTSAVDFLAFYNFTEVPHIDKEAVPEFVTDVKFMSNLSHLTDVRSEDAHFDYSDSPLFKSLL